MSIKDVIRPDVSLDFAKEFLFEYYGIQPLKISEANSYDDRTFIVATEMGPQYILKVSNIIETNAPGRLEFQNDVLVKLSEAGLPVQRPVPTKDGQFIVRKLIETRLTKDGKRGERKHGFRLISFIPGYRVCDHNVRVDAGLLFDMGEKLAKVNQALTKLCNTNAPPSDGVLWSLKSLHLLREFLDAVREEYQRELVMEGLRRFETEVLPVVETLTQGVIHADPTDQNILVQEREPKTSPKSFEVAGFIDWQDTHSCPIVFDLAVMCTYMLSSFGSEFDPDLDDIAMVRHCVEGFNSVWNLSDDELRLLPTLVIARFVQTLCLGAYSYYVLDPTNEYCLATAVRGWEQLRRLCSMDRRDILKMWTGLEYKV